MPTLCVIDEILRGTHTQERIAASSVILKHLAQKNFLCLCATHDSELTNILSDFYENYHFTEHIKDDKMIFDYKIHKGSSTSVNAIQLLEAFGYDKQLVRNAKQRIQRFEQTGKWETIP